MSLSHSPKIVTDGLILYVDVSNPKCWSGSGTNIVDLSGQGNDMTMFGSMTSSFPEGFTYGVNQITDYLSKPSFSFPADELSIEMWVSMSSFADVPIGSYAAGEAGGNDFLLFVTASSNISVYVNGAVGAQVLSSPIPTSEMCQITYTRDRIGVIQKIYLNSVEVYSGATSTAIITTGGTFIFGQEQDSVGGTFATNQCFEGQSPVYKMYDKVLTPDEVKQNFNALRGRFL